VLAIVLAGCATRAPAPARPAAPAETPAPPRAGEVGLPAPAAARTWDEFNRNAGQRLVAARPNASYTGPVPDVLLAIPVIETELYVDGTVKSIRVVREPNDVRARDTVQLAIAAIRAAAPYGDMSHLSRPWKWVEVFLFNDQRQFKPRALD
jgi:hypothetical protein